jgi:hypothetical protein
MVEPLRHRQTKEAATDMFDPKQPRHTSTLHAADVTMPLANVCCSPGQAGKERGADPEVKPLKVDHQLSVVCQSCSGYPWYVGSASDGAAPATASTLTNASAATAFIKYVFMTASPIQI